MPSPSCLEVVLARRSPLVWLLWFLGTVRRLWASRLGPPLGCSAGRCRPKRPCSCPHVHSTLRWQQGRMSQTRHYCSGRRVKDTGGEARKRRHGRQGGEIDWELGLREGEGNKKKREWLEKGEEKWWLRGKKEARWRRGREWLRLTRQKDE